MSYMSPEQCHGRGVDRRTDVFALGILLYETTTGQRLFHGDNDAAVLNRVIEVDIEPPREVDPDYPEALERVVLRALQRDPDARFADAREMLDAIEAVAAELGLRLGHGALAEQMVELFGHVPYPRPEPEVASGGTATAPSLRRTRRIGIPLRGRTIVAALTLAGALGIAGYALGARTITRDPGADATTPDDGPPTARIEAPAVEPASPSPVPGDPLPPSVATGEADEEPSPAVAEPNVPAPRRARTGAHRSRTPKKRRRDRSRAPTRPVEKPGPGDSPDSMMPRG